MFRPTPQTQASRAPSLFAAFAPLRVAHTGRSVGAEPLARGMEDEALEFLSARPVHSVKLFDMLRRDGLESPHNRGAFYCCRDERGRLEGVALIGHATLFDARTPRTLRAFAVAAQRHADGHLVMGESASVAEFWNHYCAGGPQPVRLARRELLFELSRGDVYVESGTSERLRLAVPEDLALVEPVQTRMAEEESGLNPLEVDPEGFQRRCRLRIERGRTWVITEGGRLVFKAEVMAETKAVVYLEGIYVAPDVRGPGRGLTCMMQLTGELLKRAGSICLLTDESNEATYIFYRRAGFRFVCHYDTIFLRGD